MSRSRTRSSSAWRRSSRRSTERQLRSEMARRRLAGSHTQGNSQEVAMSAGAPAVPTEVNDRAGGPKSRIVRETPAPNALVPPEASAAYPDVPDEPVLCIGEIQGNIVG